MQSRSRILLEALVASALVTAAVAAAARLPERFVAFSVGGAFLFATWVLVWRKDDATVQRYGLAFGGLVLPGRLDPREVLSHGLAAAKWALGFALVTFPLFFFGWRFYWAPSLRFSLETHALTFLNLALGQVAVIALPEEAFYRGYLQTRLGEAFEKKVRIAGAELGFELLLASLIFALGHVATIRNPGRLAVFFPALLFGFLRARTGGVGAGVMYHAMCNLWSEALGRGYGLY
ncbi:MAG: CPBP family intramembrane metalloprotease [Myxococcales bacterium]|nr:CPBP family intramembrane metalloprotease [Myxococcales bacterium]